MRAKRIEGKSDQSEYELTVIVLTYESALDKVLLSVTSAIHQKQVKLQIIIGDDGSKFFAVDKIISYMEKFHFYDYKIICHEQNQGTVVNFHDMLEVADGKYIKSLGPGDCFCSEDTAYQWLLNIKQKNSQLSFCNSVYYRKEGNDNYICAVSEVAHPQKPEVYNKGKKLQKKHYLLYNDIFAAVSVLCERTIMLEYSCMILGKIRYAEDNMFRLMLLKGVDCDYYNCNGVFYEWGDGISTSGNKEFHQAIMKDWEAGTEIVCQNCRKGIIDRLIYCCYLTAGAEKSLTDKMWGIIAHLDIMLYNRKNRRSKRMTEQADMCYLSKLIEEVWACTK